MAWEFYRRLGLKNLELNLNSVGCPNCRPAYRQALQDFLRPHLLELCPTCQERFEKNPLRILDCKNPQCQQFLQGAPTTLDALCDECHEHFEAVQSYLHAAAIPYRLNTKLVRGLDYYTNTAFEILLSDIGAQSAVCGGGRYNGLVEELGGKATPGVGFALGMERVFSALTAQKLALPEQPGLDVFVAVLDKQAQTMAFQLACNLRQSGLAAGYDTMERSLKAQFKYADSQRAAYTLLVGGEELTRDSVVLRDMQSSEQTEQSINEIVAILKEKLAK